MEVTSDKGEIRAIWRIKRRRRARRAEADSGEVQYMLVSGMALSGSSSETSSEKRKSVNRIIAGATPSIYFSLIGSDPNLKSSERRRDEMVGSQAWSFSALASVTSGVGCRTDDAMRVASRHCPGRRDRAPERKASLTRLILTHAKLTPHQIFSSSR